MNGMAKFQATVVNFKTTGKKTVVQLELTNTSAASNYMFLVGALDKDVFVQLGNPQMSMEELGVNASPIRTGATGAQITVGPSGIVERVETEADLDADEMFEDEQEQEESEQESEESVTEEEENVQPGDDFDLEFDEPGSDPGADPEGEEIVHVEGKDEVENYILGGKAPNYDDLPYDFRSLLTRKRSGETWVEIASSIHISSGKLSTDWNEYKKRVKVAMEGEQGVA